MERLLTYRRQKLAEVLIRVCGYTNAALLDVMVDEIEQAFENYDEIFERLRNYDIDTDKIIAIYNNMEVMAQLNDGSWIHGVPVKYEFINDLMYLMAGTTPLLFEILDEERRSHTIRFEEIETDFVQCEYCGRFVATIEYSQHLLDTGELIIMALDIARPA